MKRLCFTLLLLAGTLCAAAVEKSPTVVVINGSKYYVHTVQPGETLYGIAKVYQIGEQVIVQNNPAAAGGLKAAEQLRIPFIAEYAEPVSDKKLQKTFDIHLVTKGETLYAISRTFEIPVKTIIADNPNIDPAHLKLGERILLRKKAIGSETEAGSRAQWEEYRASLTSAARDGSAYHIVQPGETFYSLSHRFRITEEALSTLNNGLKAADLKAGAMLRVPGEQTAAVTPAQTLPADSAVQAPAVEEQPASRQIQFRPLSAREPLDVALLLPLAVGGGANNNYLEFYQGFLMGLDSVRTQLGYSVNLTLYNTGRDAEKIRRIAESDEFAATKLIVGPVYEQGIDPIVQFAEKHEVPVVSPLANLTRANSCAVFQMAPDPAGKYQKVADLINGDKKITLIYTASTDKEFEQEMLTLLGDSPYRKHTYRYTHPTSGSRGEGTAADLTSVLENTDDNVIIIMADNEIDVDRILAALASADTSITSRGHTPSRFVVLGNARWNRYNNIDRTVFFKDRVTFISTYHAKRDSEAVSNFDSAYIRAFGSLPTLYSYRGYDAAMIFCPAMYNDIQYDLEGSRYTPLQTTYSFGPAEGIDTHVNRNWIRVNYNPDFTITIE